MTTEIATEAPASDGKILCHIDNVMVHSIQLHIQKSHPDWTIDRYQQEFPDAPLLSPTAVAIMAKNKAAKAAAVAAPETNTVTTGLVETIGVFHEVFELGAVSAAMNASGNPISVTVLTGHDIEARDYLPDVDPDYVFSIDLLKKIVLGFQLNMPIYLWGFHGTGKTTVLQQVAARLRRPFIRVQHTINMQESDVLGQWTVKDGATHFQLGPLPMAMINGWTYCADEYDFAMPSVTAVYQPVLEGQSLLIKDAPPHFRKIIPHPNFRFVATGNTNGVGDETGLYQGTLIQNAANYSRFKITEEVQYMDPKIETAIIMAKANVQRENAAKIVKFGNAVRDMFSEGKISMTVSPRELISGAQLGFYMGANWQVGLELAFANRLSRVDKKVVQEFMQRLFV